MKRPSMLTIVWVIIVIALSTILLGIITRVISLQYIIANFFLFLFALVTIAILAIVGAVFVGIFVSHRIFSVRAFTPFEEEMLRMREDMKEIRKIVEAIKKERE